MIDYINRTFDKHIVTVEDPIEYYHPHHRCLVNQREVGVDVPSFAEALRRVLRQDPDVILVGELRDLETIEAALRAAETGHLVFGTLHTTSAQGTVTRIVDQFPVNQQEQIRVQLAGSLIGVVCQALLARIDVRGRVAAFEFMVGTSAIANLIRENKVFRIPSSIQTGKRFGMQLLDEHLFKLYAEGKISEEDAIDHGQSPATLREKIEGFKSGQVAMPGQGEEAAPAAAGAGRGGRNG
jgi:twitching motility protein PilT